MLYKKYFLLLLTTFLLSQNIWMGNSVATSDNLDVFSLNPAGFGVSRGTQQGLFIPLEENDSKASIYSSNRYSNFGYSLHHRSGDSWYHLTGVKIGFGMPLGKKNYLGMMWVKTKASPVSQYSIKLGTIMRPWNFLSIGATATMQADSDEFSTYRAGIAVRPFNCNRFTIGVDYFVNNEFDNIKSLHPFANLKIVDGVNLSFTSLMNYENEKYESSAYQLNLGMNLSKIGVYSTQNTTLANDSNGNQDKHSFGVGFYTDSEISHTIFNKKKKDSKKYMRMSLKGLFIEEKPKTSFFSSLFSSTTGQQLRSWLDDMDDFTNDPDIDGLIIDLGGVGAGFAKKNEMRRALQRFKDAGKEIIVYSEYGISGTTYFLVSMADKIFISGSTGIDLRGLNIEISFYRGLLDTLSIVPEVFRVNYDGKSYKTAGDSFLNRKMSDEMRENYTELFQSLYDIMVKGISEGRSWSIEQTKNVINEGPYMILSDAKEAGLVDSIMYADQFEKYLEDLNDGNNNIVKVNNIDRSNDYITDWVPEEKDKIAVIYAVGGIMPGNSNPGPAGSSIMGDKTINKAIKSARKDESIKAIVLRIDSGGGSALASDNMWREIFKTTTEDTTNIKPFIASMSDVAASGGYYIACEADSILADEATITGSIGVIGLRLNTSKLMKRIGINTESLTFGENADFATGSRLISAEDRARIQESIDEFYTDFKDKVKLGRANISEEDDLDEVALGRVFTGKTAAELDMYLVDKLGGLYEAIEVAKNTAGIEGDVEIVEYPNSNLENSFSFQVGATAVAKDKLINSLPEEIRSHYDMLELMKILESDDKQVILPYKIEVK